MDLGTIVSLGLAIMSVGGVLWFVWWAKFGYRNRFERAATKTACVVDQPMAKPQDLVDAITSRATNEGAPLPYN